MDLYALIILDRDKKLIEGFNKILDIFNIFTKFVESTSFSTLNNLILFYVDIKDKLTSARDENVGVLRDCANLLLENLPNRFEITDNMIAAANIDPWSQHVAYIDEILSSKNTNRLDFMMDFCRKNEIVTSVTTSDPTASTSTSGHFSKSKSSFLKSIMEKHTKTSNTNHNRDLKTELDNFKEIHLDFDENSSVLNFWKENESNFPIMANIAKKVLYITSSNAKSESSFSSAGCVINQKRASLCPLRAEKVLLIYHNTWLTEEN